MKTGPKFTVGQVVKNNVGTGHVYRVFLSKSRKTWMYLVNIPASPVTFPGVRGVINHAHLYPEWRLSVNSDELQ